MTTVILARRETRVWELVGVVIFSVMTAVTARLAVQLPFTPVPLTLQVLSVLMAGLILGPRAGAASQVGYLAAIAAGLPITATGLAGPAAFLGPTGGYLVAFVPAAYLVGRLVRPGWRTWLALVTGLGIIYGIGVGWLSLWGGYNLAQGWRLGATPFLLADAIKAILGGFLAEGGRRLLFARRER